MFRSFKKGRPGAKPVSGKRDTQPARQKQTKEAGKARKAPRRLRRLRLPWWLSFRDWGMFPWWGRFFVILGVVAIGMAIWFAVQQFRAPPPTYHLSVAVNPMGSGRVGLSSSQDDYTEGTRVTLTASVLPDYEFVSWSGDASGTSPVVTVTMDSDKEVTANFGVIEYALATSVSPPGGGSVSPGGIYDVGSLVTLTASVLPDYEFVSWSGDASGTSPVVTVTMDSDKEVTANFGVIQYALATSVSPPDGGSVSPGGIYDVGSSVTLLASALPDYEFVSWSRDASGTSPVVTVTMDSDKEVTANFVATVQEISCIMPTGISGSVVTYSNELERGEIVEGFVELTGQYYSQDWSFDWTFELIDPEGRNLDFWKGHWVEKNYHDFSFRAQYSGSYKIIVRHNSLYDKNLIIKISPMDWR